MMIVGQISSQEEAKEMEYVAKVLVISRRAKVLAEEAKKRL